MVTLRDLHVMNLFVIRITEESVIGMEKVMLYRMQEIHQDLFRVTVQKNNVSLIFNREKKK